MWSIEALILLRNCFKSLLNFYLDTFFFLSFAFFCPIPGITSYLTPIKNRVLLYIYLLASDDEGINDGRIAMKSLKSLSDNELLNGLSKLVKQEHNLTLEILLHITEVEDRKIYRVLGYSSMFVYCTEGLGYAESSANRRIYAARAIRKCPDAYRDLKNHRVNLGTLALVWQHLTSELLDEIRGKSYRQVQTIVSRFNPMIKHRDLTRPVVVQKPVEAAGERQTVGAPLKGSIGLSLAAEEQSSPELGEKTLRRGGKNPCTDARQNDSGPPTGDEISTPAQVMETVKMHQVNCLVDDPVMQMLDRCKDLLSGKFPCGIDYNTLMLELATVWLDKNDPVERSKRRKKT